MRNVRTSLMFTAVAVMFAVAISPANGQGKGGQGKGKGGFGQPGMGMGAASGLMLLRNKGVQEELKITPEQITKAEKAQGEIFAKMQEAGGFGDPEKRAELMKLMATETEKAVKEILKPEQMKRLGQIELQVGGFMALAKEDVQKELKLTEAQKTSLKELNDEVGKERIALFQGIPRGDAEKRAEAMKTMESMNKKAMTQFTSTLTAEQKKTWTEMTGAKFDYKPEAFTPPARRDL